MTQQHSLVLASRGQINISTQNSLLGYHHNVPLMLKEKEEDDKEEEEEKEVVVRKEKEGWGMGGVI